MSFYANESDLLGFWRNVAMNYELNTEWDFLNVEIWVGPFP